MYLSQKHISRRAVLKGVGATIALPLLASALASSTADTIAKRVKPEFTLAGKTMTIDGHAVSAERFEEMNESAV